MSLFYLPRVHSEPGAKIYFRATGTSTPQNTYTDIALTVAHANPVVADADGYFDPIYFDPSLPNYRVIHTDGSDAGNDPTLETLLEPTQDDVPSGDTEGRYLRLRGTAPALILEETDQIANSKKWFVRASGNVMEIGPLNDAEGAFTVAASISRAGVVTIGSLAATAATVGGTSAATTTSSTFTGTMTGLTTSPTGTVQYTIAGGIATITLPTSLVGTSNTTACTITGLPDALKPTTTKIVSMPKYCFGDNGALNATVDVRMDSTLNAITFLLAGSATGFTNSGSKGVSAAFCFAYPLS
jgi:hypothetical protein